MKFTLCRAEDIDEPGSMGFEIDHDGDRIELFVVRKWDEFHAYINRCPHQGTNLDWQEHQFLDRGNDFIQCATHDALFEIPTGLCVNGPCVGASLEPVALSQADGELVVEF